MILGNPIMAGSQSKIKLPDEYQLTAYVGSTGRNYIGTRRPVTMHDKWFVQYMAVTASSPGAYEHLVQCNAGTSNGFQFMRNNKTNNLLIKTYNEHYASIANGLVNGIYSVALDFETGEYFFNGLLKGVMTINEIASSNTENVTVVPRVNAWWIMRFKVYEADTLVTDFVPCRRLSDDVAGMYDLISGEFNYGGTTNGTTVSGPDVIQLLEIP